jgi:hypothetical protein
MRDPYRNLHSSCSSRFYTLEAAAAEPRLLEHLCRHRRAPRDFYGHMFVEDASSLLPWGHGLEDGFTATTTPATPELRDLLRNALPGINGVPSSLEYGIRDHLQRTARELLLGEAIYEVDYLTPSAEPTSQPVGFRIAWIFPPGSVARVRRRYVQYVPTELGGTDTINGLHYRDLNTQNLMILRLGWRRRRSLGHALAVMAAADKQTATPHRMATTPHSDFDLARFKARLAEEVLSATREVGWRGSGSFDDQMLPPYAVWRHLQFERFKIELRDYILAGLQTTLERAGARLGVQAKLELAGLITSADIDRAEADLKTGSRALAELLTLRA